MGSICNGILSMCIRYRRCPTCKCKRRFTVYERYDSFLWECSRGHVFATE